MGTPTYLYHVVAEQGPSWYSAISGHPHAQSPAYDTSARPPRIPGVTGVAVNHYWRGSGSTTEAFIAVNAWPQTLGSRDRATHYVFSGIFETSDFGGPKPYLNRLWQTFELRRTNWVAGGTSHDAHRVVAGISWSDVQGRRYILEICIDSSDNSEGWAETGPSACQGGITAPSSATSRWVGGPLRLWRVDRRQKEFRHLFGLLITATCALRNV